MSRYTGLSCVSCKKTFSDGDDIVVCPDCGAPHHRSCYEALGHCTLQDKHSDKFIWQAHIPDADNANGQSHAAICPNCNAANPPHGRFCQMCGTPLENDSADAQGSSRSYGQYNRHAQSDGGLPDAAPRPDGGAPAFDRWNIDGITSQELSAYTGSSSYYFLRQFKWILGTQYNMSWNWSALVFSFFYFFYRKMYKVGFALLGFYIVSSIPSLLCYLGPTDATIEMMGVTIGYNSHMLDQVAPFAVVFNTMHLFLRIWCAVFANKLYLKSALQNIKRYKKESGIPESTPEYYSGLYYLGSPNRLAAVLICFGFFTAYSILINFMTWSMV